MGCGCRFGSPTRSRRCRPVDCGTQYRTVRSTGSNISQTTDNRSDDHLHGRWPFTDVQTVYADQPGSAEMPSRRSTVHRPPDHSSWSSAASPSHPSPCIQDSPPQEKHEPPAPERFAVPEPTARLVNTTRAAGGRVVAVGTHRRTRAGDLVRADGKVRAGADWTDLVVSRARPPRAVDGLITGLHEPEASHLLLLEAVAGTDLVGRAYEQAVTHRYLWHEFGDSMLFLPYSSWMGPRPWQLRPTLRCASTARKVDVDGIWLVVDPSIRASPGTDRRELPMPWPEARSR